MRILVKAERLTRYGVRTGLISYLNKDGVFGAKRFAKEFASEEEVRIALKLVSNETLDKYLVDFDVL